MLESKMVQDFLKLAKIYQSSCGLTQTTVSQHIFSSGMAIKKLLADDNITIRRMHNANQWLSDNWPDSLPWPAKIPRQQKIEKKEPAPIDPYMLNGAKKIKNTKAFCKAIGVKHGDFYATINDYKIGGPKEKETPRPGSQRAHILAELVKADDTRVLTKQRKDLKKLGAYA